MTEVRMRRGRFIGGVIAALTLAACGGGGGGGGGSASVGGSADAGGNAGAGGSSGSATNGADQAAAAPGSNAAGPSTPVDVGHRLYVVDSAHSVLAMFDTLTPAAGSTLAGLTLSAPQLRGALAYDSQRDLLYVVSGNSVLVFADASLMTAQSAPARTIALTPDFLWIDALQLDPSTDALFVAGRRTYDSQVLVFEQASTLSGTPVAARSMTINDGVRSFAIDSSRAIMYTVSSVTGVNVFTGIDKASGTQWPARFMLQNLITDSLALDASSDRLYVTYTTATTAGVQIVDEASTTGLRSGTLTIANPRSVAIDVANDTLYVAAYEKGYVIQGASRISGTASTPAATIVAPTGTAIGGFAFA